MIEYEKNNLIIDLNTTINTIYFSMLKHLMFYLKNTNLENRLNGLIIHKYRSIHRKLKFH